ncbi:hypothetical protein FRB99_004267 [Tulasnella sp. 403]|nr:hypothetical protein FRB99_004267 [Tulasnella sp. 403]
MDAVPPGLRIKKRVQVDKTACSIGGSCRVYRGRNSYLGEVALKLLTSFPEGGKEILVAEITTWKALSHPHILQFYGLHKQKDRLYMVSPWAENGSLSSYLKENPDEDRIRFIRETAAALHYLFEENIIHGDIKGNNILVSATTHALLCDFGLSRLSGASTLVHLKGHGTPRYLAPELWDDKPKSFESDAFAFGMTIYEILSGNEPFPNLKSCETICRAILEGERPPRESSTSKSSDDRVYESVWDIAKRCWEAEAPSRASITRTYQELLALSPPSPQETSPNQAPTRENAPTVGLCTGVTHVLGIPARPGGDIVTVPNDLPIYETDTSIIMKGTNEKVGDVAVKLLKYTTDDHYLEQAIHIRQEARVWQGLNHPNVLRFIGIAEDTDRRLYLISPWVNDGSLDIYLRAHPDANRPEFILQTASALVHLHENNIIHGDIKASNILVSSEREPHALLCDFGSSRLNIDPTLPGLKGIGPVRWQAPELWDNQPKSYRSDSYSFGVTIYEILSGKEPYHDCKVHGNLLSRVYGGERPPKEPKFRPGSTESWEYLWDVAGRCWKHEPDERPSMNAVYRWLQNKRVDEEAG